MMMVRRNLPMTFCVSDLHRTSISHRLLRFSTRNTIYAAYWEEKHTLPLVDFWWLQLSSCRVHCTFFLRHISGRHLEMVCCITPNWSASSVCICGEFSANSCPKSLLSHFRGPPVLCLAICQKSSLLNRLNQRLLIFFLVGIRKKFSAGYASYMLPFFDSSEPNTFCSVWPKRIW